MNIQKLKKFVAALFAALFVVTLAPAAKAGPSSPEVFRPVMTMTTAKQIPVGSKIALSCDNGGPVTVVTVNKDRSYLKGFTCPVSKRRYHVRQGGSGHTPDQFDYQATGGYTAHLLSYRKL
jgi:hypothetical protein